MSQPEEQKTKHKSLKKKSVPVKIPEKEKDNWCFGCHQKLANQEAHMGPGGCLEEK